VFTRHGFGQAANSSSPKKSACYQMLQDAPDLDIFFVKTSATENEHETQICNVRAAPKQSSLKTVAL
jgi:hypothetical protein